MALETVGLRTSLWNNNLKSLFLLSLFPIVLGSLIWTLVILLIEDVQTAMMATLVGLALVGLWFLIAFAFQEQLTMGLVHAQTIDRKAHPQLYNLTENLAITAGIQMPKLYMMDTDALNAFASGIRINNAVICVTRGLVERLNVKELEAVLAHEMSHITHRDMRLMTIATLFVGIIALIAEIALRSLRYQRHSRNKKAIPILVIVIIVATIGYFIAILSKFALSRRREYMADAGSVVLTKDKDAMIAALQKISGQSELEDAPEDLRFMLFDNTKSYLGLFQTHPSIEKRIQALRGY